MKTRLNRTVYNSALRGFVINDQIRNIGVAAHVDAGKTTITERMLLLAGAIHSAGEVHNGNTTMDHKSVEQKHGITVTSAAISCEWTQSEDQGLQKLFVGKEIELNIIDTPGHVDFTAEVERSCRVLDGAVVALCGVAGVQPQTETVWNQVNRYGVPRVVFVNKMDREGADFDRVVAELESRLKVRAAVVGVPLEGRKLLDVVNGRLIRFVSDDGAKYEIMDTSSELNVEIENRRQLIIETLSEFDDGIAESYLNGESISPTRLKLAIREATLERRLTPVLGGSAYKYSGIPFLLDAVVDYLPSPADVTEIKGIDPETGGEVLYPVNNDPSRTCALVFKFENGKHSGRIAFTRVYSGVLKKGDYLENKRAGTKMRISRLVRVAADRHFEIEECEAGGIAAIVGMKDLATGDTLTADAVNLVLEPPVFPKPVVSKSIEPDTRKDQEKLSQALYLLATEDPTFVVTRNEETNQTLVSGMGELHLDIVGERLLDEFGVQASLGAPRIAYRETVTRASDGEFFLRKQKGGQGAYAKVRLRIAPNERDGGIVIEDRTTGGTIPHQFVAACFKGVRQALESGVLGAYPVVDVRVELLDGDSHTNDSNEMAFKIAAMEAVRLALADASCRLLEPIMSVETSTPEEAQGAVLEDLNRRRGLVREVERRADGDIIVRFGAPLSEMSGYAESVRSLSRGRATYSMQPELLDFVPDGLVRSIVDR